MLRRMIITTMLFLSVSCCKENTIVVELVNFDDCRVNLCLPFKYNRVSRPHDMHDIPQSDTTLMTALNALWRITVEPHSSKAVGSGYSTFEGMTPYDTVRFYICVFRLYAKDRKEDDLLVRYDLSIKDMEQLTDSQKRLRLCYPPDERMKNVKMWPKYETFY